MKTARYFSVSMLALLALSSAALADDAEVKNPYGQADPDGVPMSVTTPRNSSAPVQIDTLRRQAAEEAHARNWLLLEYEKQLQLNSEKDPDKDKPANLYLQLSMDKNLAKLAGLQDFNAEMPPPAPAPLTSSSPKDKNAPALRADTGITPAQRGQFVPLITPLNSPGAQSVMNFSTVLPLTPPLSSLGFSTPPNPAPTPTPASAHSSAYTEVTDLQTPGMIASKDTAGSVSATPDLTLDALPDETPDQARAREEANTRVVLPVPMDSDLLHQQQASRLKVPGPATVAKVDTTKPAAAPPKAIPVNPEDAPVQINQQAQIVPIHGAIANPYDILDR
jgi:hypothetical protein